MFEEASFLRFFTEGVNLIGIVSLVAGLWALRKSRQGGALTYKVESVPVFEVNAEPTIRSALEVRYMGRPVDRLTISTVTLWNTGNAPIRSEQMSRYDPVSIVLPKGVLALRTWLASSTSGVSAPGLGLVEQLPEGAVLPESPNQQPIAFEFIEPGHGLMIGLLHDGDRDAISVRGKMAGVPLSPWRVTRTSSVVTGFVLAAAFVIIMGCAMLADIYLPGSTHTPSTYFSLDGADAALRSVALALVALSLYGFLVVKIIQMGQRTPPDGLRAAMHADRQRDQPAE